MELLLVVLGAVLYLAYRYMKGRPGQMTPLGIPGKLLFADQGRASRLFVNHRFGVTAKPDFILQMPSGENALAEYKDRAHKVYESDIVQVKVSALAVRAHMPLQKAYVVTRNGPQEVLLNPDDDALYAEVEQNITWARQVKHRQLINVFCQNKNQCASCSVSQACNKN